MTRQKCARCIRRSSSTTRASRRSGRKKELEERRDKTGLPGFPVDFDQLKSGQYVELYMVKPAPMKAQPKKKKGPDDDPPPETMGRPEFIMVVILSDPAAPK